MPGLSASLSYKGPLPLPGHLQGYEDVQEGFAERIMAMAEAAHETSVRARLIPVRAEAAALLVSTTAVAFFPWAAFAAAAILAVNGLDVAALITVIAGAVSAGPQIIAATRRPRAAQQQPQQAAQRSPKPAPKKKRRRK